MALPLLGRKHMVVGLMLEFRRLEKRTNLGAKKFDTVALIGFVTQPHPNQVNMVGHKTISRANQSFAYRSVKHHLAKCRMETVGQPALLTMGNGHGPEHNGVSLVELVLQPRQVMGKI
jgi:hypothetical protein